MATKGYNGRTVIKLNNSHKEYALLQFGNEYQIAPKCIYEMNLDNWLLEAEESDVYRLWWHYELL